jgi:hypothetical protein
MITFDSTKSDCLLDLTMSYGRFASTRLAKVINEREEVLGRKLERNEILDAHREIDEQLSQTLLTRQSK